MRCNAIALLLPLLLVPAGSGLRHRWPAHPVLVLGAGCGAGPPPLPRRADDGR